MLSLTPPESAKVKMRDRDLFFLALAYQTEKELEEFKRKKRRGKAGSFCGP
jgi:hypothetical protein